jgi:hypothetical protein
MSTALAVAGVTAVIRGMLDSWLGSQSASAALGGASAEVTAVPPDTIALTGTDAVPRLNLFLHHVAPNQGWRNVDLPSADGRGRRVANPPLAIDLRYLLTAYGPQELQAEVLLGLGMQLLHQVPVLDRDDIEDRLPSTLLSSQLGRQVETIRITQEPMGTDELSKLWSALQAHYRPSAAYHVSVVLIEPTTAARAAAPVLTRGPVDSATQREQGVAVRPDLVSPLPGITAVRPPDRQHGAGLGQIVDVEGHDLDGTNRVVRLESRLLGVDREVNALAGADARLVRFTVPNQPAQLPVGIYALRVLVRKPGEPEPRETNQLALTILPRITTALPLNVTRDGQGDVTIVLQCRPQVRPHQRASLILGSREVPAEDHPTPTDTLTFVVRDALVGSHLVRLRVDGVDSAAVDRTATPPRFLDRRVVVS